MDERTGPLGSLVSTPDLDRWLAFTPDRRVLLRTGKVELGQGIRTALTAIAADELGVDPSRIDVAAAATGITPDERVTAGSGSIEQSGAAVRQACAHARLLLLDRAAAALGVAFASLTVEDGTVRTPDGSQVTYWELAVGRSFDHRVEVAIAPIPPAHRRWTGRGLPRVDLPAKVRGEPAFLQDLVLPGMQHARIIRPACPGARLSGAVPASIEGADVVRNGSFLAVVADRERVAVRAATALAAETRWEGGDTAEAEADTVEHLIGHADEEVLIVDGESVDLPPGPPLDHAGADRVVRATYSKPFLLHGSIGPSAAVARFEDGRLSVWSHTQSVELLRLALAEALRLDAGAVAVCHVDGPGCYGHNGADDAAMDAALVAMARPGRPVRVIWTREDEHGWEPVAPAMAVTVEAGIRDGRITSWQHDVYSYTHVSRAFPLGESFSNLLASWYVDSPLERPVPRPSRGFHMGGHRNADPLYAVGERRVVKHFLRSTPLRTSSTRALGAFANVFAIESFMDELAADVGQDPVAFRLSHLDDPRARDVLEMVVSMAGGLTAPGGEDAPGRGLAFARYENCKAYAAVVVEATADWRTGEIALLQVWIAVDAGEVIDPDGLVNQVEGGFLQAASWTLKERVVIGERGVASRDWASYPILRFTEVPAIATQLLDRPELPPLGAGEATTGPAGAAIANAVAQQTGVRFRDLPLRPDVVREGLRAAL